MLARDDGAINIGIVRCGHQLFLGSITGRPTNGKGGAEGQVKLAGRVRVVPAWVPEDDTEDWQVSEPCMETWWAGQKEAHSRP